MSSRITGQGDTVLDVVFDGSQAQSKIKLIASTVAQSLDLHLFFVLSNRDQDRFVVIAKTGGQARMISEGKIENSSLARFKTGP